VELFLFGVFVFAIGLLLVLLGVVAPNWFMAGLERRVLSALVGRRGARGIVVAGGSLLIFLGIALMILPALA